VPAKLLTKFTQLPVSSPERVSTASLSGSSKQTQPYKDDINYILPIVSHQSIASHLALLYVLPPLHVTGVKNNGKNVWDIRELLLVIFVSAMLAQSKMLVCTPTVADTTHNINPLNAELNSICHFLALLRSHPILHGSRIRVNHKELFHINTSYKHVSSRLPQMNLYSNRKLTIRYLLGCLQEHLHSNNILKHNLIK
jgi:hypothetical protein